VSKISKLKFYYWAIWRW